MEKVKALVDYLNDILSNGQQTLEKYEEYYRQLSQLLYDIDTEFDLELVTDGVKKGSALLDPQKNLVQIYLDPENDFHYFVYEVIDDFLHKEEYVAQALDYFSSLVRNDKIDYIASVLIGIGDRQELTEEEDKVVTGAHEYLWQMMDLMAGQDEEDMESDILFSIKIINSLLRFASLDLQNMYLFELQYDFGMLNLETLQQFLGQDIEALNMEDEFKEMYYQAKDIIEKLIYDIETFHPNSKILSLSKDEMADKISQMEYMEILRWLNYLRNNNMHDEYKATVLKVIDQQAYSLDHQNWEDALVLGNILVSMDPGNSYFRTLRLLALLGLRIYYDAYQDYLKLDKGKLIDNEGTKEFIHKQLSAVGLK